MNLFRLNPIQWILLTVEQLSIFYNKTGDVRIMSLRLVREICCRGKGIFINVLVCVFVRSRACVHVGTRACERVQAHTCIEPC
jgi:hypothetical protein